MLVNIMPPDLYLIRTCPATPSSFPILHFKLSDGALIFETTVNTFKS
jgi:hypothetical protein